MTRSSPLYVGFTMGALALAACGETATEPEAAPVPSAEPALAVASNSWVSRADMPSTQRYNLATAVVTNGAGQSILYAIGGSTSTQGSLSSVQAYNVATNSWSWKAPLPQPLYSTNGAGVIGNKIYISGGIASYKNYRSELYMYDPASNAWTRKRDMPINSYSGVTGVINNQLYVLTGCDQEDCYSYEPIAFYRYDPVTDGWTRLAAPTVSHQRGMAGVIGGKFYAAGGGWGSSELEVYDPATNRWTSKAPLPRGRWAGVGVALGGKLFVIGGINSDYSAVRTTSVYNPATNSWTNVAPMPTARASFAGSRVVLNGQARIEIVGGVRPGNNLAYIP